ncbi:hypothetical protein M378DRAFT_169272, partial [Amanita muscaria Koide BX008]
MPPAPAYPRSPTRYGPSAASTTGSPSEISTLSVGASGPGQPAQTMPSLINLKLQPSQLPVKTEEFSSPDLSATPPSLHHHFQYKFHFYAFARSITQR